MTNSFALEKEEKEIDRLGMLKEVDVLVSSEISSERRMSVPLCLSFLHSVCTMKKFLLIYYINNIIYTVLIYYYIDNII